jgi:hypothetical protein
VQVPALFVGCSWGFPAFKSPRKPQPYPRITPGCQLDFSASKLFLTLVVAGSVRCRARRHKSEQRRRLARRRQNGVCHRLGGV